MDFLALTPVRRRPYKPSYTGRLELQQPSVYWAWYMGLGHQVRMVAFFASQAAIAWTMQPLIGAFDIYGDPSEREQSCDFNLDVFVGTMVVILRPFLEFRKGRDRQRVGCSVGNRFDESG